VQEIYKEPFQGDRNKSSPSTSLSAKLHPNQKKIAAIASAESAKMYGLDILNENIQDVMRTSPDSLLLAKQPHLYREMTKHPL